MKGIQRLIVAVLVLGVTYLPGAFAGENFVTADQLSISDVMPFVEAQFRDEVTVGSFTRVIITGIEHKGTRATVTCELCYPQTFSNVKHEPRTVIFERTVMGKWLNPASGKFLTK